MRQNPATRIIRDPADGRLIARLTTLLAETDDPTLAIERVRLADARCVTCLAHVRPLDAAVVSTGLGPRVAHLGHCHCIAVYELTRNLAARIRARRMTA